MAESWASPRVGCVRFTLRQFSTYEAGSQPWTEKRSNYRFTYKIGRVASAALLTVAITFLAAAPVGAVVWDPPVDAPIVDGFRPPQNPYGSGNRGVEYGLEPGTPVTAVDDGRVTYVGRIGSGTHVVVDHGEGLKSTYAFIESATVIRGQRVKRGQQVAIAGPGFHLTARLWGEYVDPMLLFGGAEVQVNLADGPLLIDGNRFSARLRVVSAPTIKNWHAFGGLIPT